MIAWVVNTVKAVLLTVLSIIKYILRCGRKKGSSGYFEHQSSSSLPQSFSTGASGTGADRDVDWDRWEDQPSEIVIGGGGGGSKPTTVEDHIRAYRDAKRKQSEAKEDEDREVEEEPEKDLLASLEPTVTRAKKLYVGGSASKAAPSQHAKASIKSSRLGVKEEMADPLLAMGGELEEWGEGTASGWQAEDDDLNEALREQRKKQQRIRSGMS